MSDIKRLAPSGDEGDALLSPQQLANHLGVSRKTLERMRMTGETPVFIKISPKIVRYRMRDVQAFVEKCAMANTSIKV